MTLKETFVSESSKADNCKVILGIRMPEVYSNKQAYIRKLMAMQKM